MINPLQIATRGRIAWVKRAITIATLGLITFDTDDSLTNEKVSLVSKVSPILTFNSKFTSASRYKSFAFYNILSKSDFLSNIYVNSLFEEKVSMVSGSYFKVNLASKIVGISTYRSLMNSDDSTSSNITEEVGIASNGSKNVSLISKTTSKNG